MIKYFNEVVAELQSKGTIFGAEYRKKNGELTKINGRFGVSKFVKGEIENFTSTTEEQGYPVDITAIVEDVVEQLINKLRA